MRKSFLPPYLRIAGLIVVLSGSVAFTACSDQPFAPSAPSGVAGAAGGLPVTASTFGSPESSDILNQGGVGVYAANGAMLVRQTNGLRASITMPTPQPGQYVYAPGRTEVGHPEVFTLWAFIFNYPENCIGPCDGNDLGVGTAAKGGVYNAGGHAAAGMSLTIAGRIGVGAAPFSPMFAALESPGTAEVHLAVAPHGALDPALLPEDFRLPTGSPACGCWWVSFFK